MYFYDQGYIMSFMQNAKISARSLVISIYEISQVDPYPSYKTSYIMSVTKRSTCSIDYID